MTSARVSIGWRCPTCRARGVVVVAADAHLSAAMAASKAIGDAHSAKQPTCDGVPTIERGMGSIPTATESNA